MLAIYLIKFVFKIVIFLRSEADTHVVWSVDCCVLLTEEFNFECWRSIRSVMKAGLDTKHTDILVLWRRMLEWSPGCSLLRMYLH